MDDSPKTGWKKTIFSVVLIAFSLWTAVKMGFDTSLTTKVSEIVADGLITLSMFTAVTFLTTDSVDKSGVLHKLGQRMSRGPAGMMLPITPPPPEASAIDPDLAKG